jgi:uncharacterized membrane protein
VTGLGKVVTDVLAALLLALILWRDASHTQLPPRARVTKELPKQNQVEPDAMPRRHHRAAERPVFLSDGVFAIAMTLLSVELVSKWTQPEGGTTLSALMSPTSTARLFAFVVSFLVVAAYWVTHRRLFHHILETDGSLIWLNILFLMVIAFIPFPTAIISENRDDVGAIFLYSLILGFAGIVLALVFLYAFQWRHFGDTELSGHYVLRGIWRIMLAPTGFLLAAVLAFWSPEIAKWTWLATGLAYLVNSLIVRGRDLEL